MYNILSRVNNGEESIEPSYRLSKMIVCEVFPIVIVKLYTYDRGDDYVF